MASPAQDSGKSGGAQTSERTETVKRALEINAGLAILPASTVRNEVERNQLVSFKLEGGIHNRSLSVIYKKNRVLTPALRSFIELMKEGVDMKDLWKY